MFENLHQIVHGKRLVQDLPNFFPRAVDKRNPTHRAILADIFRGVVRTETAIQRGIDTAGNPAGAAMEGM